jgi:preprotein translocase subunit YajC
MELGSTIIMLIAMLAIFYFMLIRPENKRKKEAEELRNSLKVGDEITTIGGIIGKVVEKDGDCLTLCIDEEKQVYMKVVIYAVSQVSGKNA